MGAGRDCNGEQVVIIQDAVMDEENEYEMGHDQRRQMLVDHFTYKMSMNEVFWPRQHGITYAYNPNSEIYSIFVFVI